MEYSNASLVVVHANDANECRVTDGNVDLTEVLLIANAHDVIKPTLIWITSIRSTSLDGWIWSVLGRSNGNEPLGLNALATSNALIIIYATRINNLQSSSLLVIKIIYHFCSNE